MISFISNHKELNLQRNIAVLKNVLKTYFHACQIDAVVYCSQCKWQGITCLFFLAYIINACEYLYKMSLQELKSNLLVGILFNVLKFFYICFKK